LQTTLSDIERQRIRIALIEDTGKGDPTTLATIPEGMEGTGVFLAKADGVLAGVDIARHTFNLYEVVMGVASPVFSYKEFKSDGESVKAGEPIAEVRAQMRTLLSAERVALNLMQRMSGIATTTAAYVEAVRGTNATILDTRKTAPLLRPFDRYAVRAGGGTNHRYSLSEMVLVKDNHVAANGGSIERVLDRLEEYFSDDKVERVPIEIEVTSLDQLETLLKHANGRVHRVMFDNFKVKQLAEGIKRVAGELETEASGGVNLTTVRAIAETRVDFISVGALTHSVIGLDISLEIEEVL
jgi:nicotinate-nucleotide pyrophosphorylase (carboxylating)